MAERRLSFQPSEFAQAYIQTLPHALLREDFSSDDEYINYLDERREYYFDEFITALYRVHDYNEKYTTE